MRLLATIIFFSFLLQDLIAQDKERVYVDETGKVISRIEFRTKWTNEDLLLSAWSQIREDGKRYTTLQKDLYMNGVFEYNVLKVKLEKIIKRNINDSSIILIKYHYYDDLCNTASKDNIWSKTEIRSQKEFLQPMLKDLKKEEIIFISLFEESLELNNNMKRKNEYFFLDEGDFFRKSLFTNPTLCGSFALIKPNGETLIRNGEYRADWMADHLKPSNWSLFFN